MKYLILFIAIATLFKPVWPVVEYAINYEYISKYLCENTDKPEMHCDGKCYLSKMLAKEADDHKDNPFDSKQYKTEVLHIVNFEPISFGNLQTEDQIGKPLFGKNEAVFSNLFTFDIPHPPNA